MKGIGFLDLDPNKPFLPLVPFQSLCQMQQPQTDFQVISLPLTRGTSRIFYSNAFRFSCTRHASRAALLYCNPFTA